jgi:acetyl-CoA synthase
VDKVRSPSIPSRKIETVEQAQVAYRGRMTALAASPTSVDTFYSSCQSFAPTHVCVITRNVPTSVVLQLAGGKAAYEMNPTGGNQPVPKGVTVDEERGQWAAADM